MIYLALLICLLPVLCWGVFKLYIEPLSSPLGNLPGPDSGWGLCLGGHLRQVLNASMSKATHEDYVNKYGRNIRIKGLGRFEDRLLTTDPVALGYVLNHPKLYEKPWQSRRVISRLIGEGMLAAEGPEHKRMRGVGNPAFSVQNMRAFVPITFKKAFELRDKWNTMIDQSNSKSTEEKEWMSNDSKQSEAKLDVCHWISRATFDVIGLAGFDYSFSAIQHETNELFMAYKDMFEIAVSRGETLLDIAIVYFPWLEEYFPNEKTRTVQRSQEIINRVGTQIIKEKTRRVVEGEANGSEYKGIDFLTLLIKSNLAKNTPEHMRISDEELLANVNTFFFAGSDTTSLALTWILYLLAAHPNIQNRLRVELRAFTEAGHDIPSDPESPDWQNLWSGLDELPFLNNVIRETLRLIPPVHSSIRVAVEDGVIPTVDAIKMRDGSVQYGINIQEGQFIHIPIESMNVDKGVWGEDAWSFNPDRWDDLPDAVLDQPGLYNHTLSFSSGPRACIGMKFSVIEMKSFLHVLLTNFAFDRDEGERIFAANVVLTRPYVAGKFMEGSQCPLYVSRIQALMKNHHDPQQ